MIVVVGGALAQASKPISLEHSKQVVCKFREKHYKSLFGKHKGQRYLTEFLSFYFNASIKTSANEYREPEVNHRQYQTV